MIDEQNIIQKLQHGLDEYLLKNPNEEDSEVLMFLTMKKPKNYFMNMQTMITKRKNSIEYLRK